MNRRDFIKAAPMIAALPAIVSAEEEGYGCPIGPKGEVGESGWRYVVYCYERGQGEWTFSQNTRGSFAHQREYMTFDEEDSLTWNPHYVGGWMDGGKLHFASFDDATDFVDCHVRTKEDVNIIDSIYDVYYVVNEPETQTEIQVAHYWFNGDTGSQIRWETPEIYTNWNAVEFG